MIVGNQPQFIFVHIFKTAGTSIKRSMRRYAMPGWQEYANVVLKRIGISQFGPIMYPDHMRACQLIDQIGIEQFKSRFSFAFVRNPWDWELSHYKFILKLKRHPKHNEVSGLGSFDEYVRWKCDGRFQLQRDFVVYENEVVVDFIGRFENLASDFGKVCQHLKIKPKLAKLNATRKTSYVELYNDRTAELVRQTYLPDIQQFGYEFAEKKSEAA